MLFRQLGEHLSAAAMALVKSALACGVLLALLLPRAPAAPPLEAVVLLAISGIAGISLGDTLYFATLTRLGARLTLLLGTLIPLTTAVAATALFGEHLGPLTWLAIGITLAGIAYVLWERNPDGTRPPRPAGGLLFALGFVAANSAGILLTKRGVADVGSLEATFYREAAATFALGVWGAVGGTLLPWLRPLRARNLWPPLLAAAFIGSFAGTWLSVAALKYTYTAVAATLNATSPLFILPLGWLVYRESVSRRALLGAVVAVTGIGCYYFSVW